MNKEEPSVLDYILAKLMPWRGPAPAIPPAEKPIPKPDTGASVSRPDKSVEAAHPEPDWVSLAAASESVPEDDWESAVVAAPESMAAAVMPPETTPVIAAETVKETERVIVWPWRALLALVLALLAQVSLEPSAAREWLPGVVLYGLAAAALVWANLRAEWVAAPLPESKPRLDPMTVRWLPLVLGMALAVAAFREFKDNLFTGINLTLWALALVFTLRAFWLDAPRSKPSWLGRVWAFLRRPKWKVEITGWTLLVLAVISVVLYFRVYHISQVPPEMVSDHAEKLLDVSDVLDGQWHIFFPRNTGREAIQFYLTAFIVRYLGTGVSFLSLKIGTVLVGLLTLPFIYLLGKEMGSRRAGLLAAFFAGIGYWPNVISRMGLRFPLYPLFVAPALYFLLRGLRTSNRNDFILSGLALGIGLHGYTPIRILPVVIVIAVGVYMLHRHVHEARRQALVGLVLLAVVSFLVFLPLLRYAEENPDMFGYRALTRLGTVERPLPGPAGQIFLQNTWKAVTMFGWDDGEIWPVSVTHRPALDVVSAALFYLGIGLLLLRYLRRCHWLDLFMVLSVPLLMMPSILSLAFPSENPALNRAAGALVPVFLIVGLSLDGLMTGIQAGLGRVWGSRLAWSLALVLGVFACRQNYDLVFNQYQSVYTASSWNTSEMGAVIRDFANSVGSPDTAYVAAFPYWVDTRLVGINAGYPRTDYAIWPDHFQDTKADPRAKLFLVKPEDTAGLDTLRQLYPQGVSTTYVSKVQDHDFILFFVPPALP